jgi:hypothetical protein
MNFIIQPQKKPANLDIIPTFMREVSENSLHTSDIAGTDLYAEALDAYVAGNSSMLKHSIFTNDTNILKSFDLEDPAFSKCNILLAASNGIQPNIFPLPLTERKIEEQFKSPINSFIGFLYYAPDVTEENAQERSERAFEIIENNLLMDLIMVNSSEPNFYPFIGYYPQWDILLKQFTGNIPKDGYWKTFDLQRLLGKNYRNNKHLSFSYALINSPELFQKDINFGNDQLNFNIGASISQFLDGGTLDEAFSELNAILGQNEDLLGSFGPILGLNESNSVENLENTSSTFGDFTFANNSHYSIVEVQYEGKQSGIQHIEGDKYEFNLLTALGYPPTLLAPSEKVYSALIGSFLSSLDVNVLCTDIIHSTPKSVDFSDYLIDQLALLTSFVDIGFDIQSLQNYSFTLSWKDRGGLKDSYANLVNENDEFDVINFLPTLGFSGFPTFPSGLANPLNNLKVKYELSDSEGNIKLQNMLLGDNATFGAYKNFDFNVSAQTAGNVSAYGIPTSIPIELEDVFPIILALEGWNTNFAEDLQDTMWQIVQEEYKGEYNNLSDFYNYDEDPRIFQFDTEGDGSNNYYFPDFSNISNLYPYNDKMDEISDILLSEHPQLLNQLDNTSPEIQTAQRIEELFSNEDSIWNDDNWELEPDEILSYLSENYSIADSDTYTKFHEFNFIINDSIPLPTIIFGDEDEETAPEMALTPNNENWTIFSEEYLDENRLEIQFSAQNNSIVDLINNTLDRVSLVCNFTESYPDLEIEMFNFTSEEYFNLENYLNSETNTSMVFSITKYNKSIEDIFYNSEGGDYTILFNIKKTADDQFNISIDNIDIKFLMRDVNPVEIQSNIKYSSVSGNVKYIHHSNSIMLSTDNMSSIVSYSSLSQYVSSQGDNITYSMSIKNIGSAPAKNITIKIPILGIIQTNYDFSISDDYFYYDLTKLNPTQEKHLNFSFYIPNSGLIETHQIEYNNSALLEKGNSTALSSYPNDLFSVAPVNYDNRFPYIHIIDIILNSSKDSPAISEVFNLSVNIKNCGPKEIPINQINISSIDQYGDLIRTSNECLIFNNIEYNHLKSINFSVNKTEWKGYLYPAISLLNNINKKTFQIRQSVPLVLGSIIISVEKSVDKKELERGELLLVNIKITNIGTITARDLKLDDILGYPQEGFTLNTGSLIKTIDRLDPGEHDSIYYTIKAHSQIKTILNSANVEYEYLYQKNAYSNIIPVKAIIPKTIQNLNILIPNSIVGGVVLIYLWYMKKYKKQMLESERKEIKVLSLTSRDSILTSELSLREYLSRGHLKQNLKQTKGGK